MLFSFVLSLPPVQTKIAKYITKELRKTYDINVNVKKVDLSVFGKVSMESITVLDANLDTILDVNKIRGNIDKLNISQGGKLKVDDLFLIDGILNIKIFDTDKQKSEPDKNNSNIEELISRVNVKKTSKKETSTFEFKSTGVNLKNFKFKYEDLRKEVDKTIILSNINLGIRDINVRENNVKFKINEFNFLSKEGLEVENIEGDFIYNPKFISVKNLELKTENTTIKTELGLKYSSIADLVNKNKDVEVYFAIKESIISLKDVNYFIPLKSNENIKLDVEINGDLAELDINKLDIKAGGNTEIKGTATVDDIMYANEYICNIKLSKFTSDYSDISEVLTNISEETVIDSIFSKVGIFDMSGEISIEHNYLYTDLLLNTDVGNISSKVAINQVDSTANVSYRGSVKIDSLDMKTVLENNEFGFASMEVQLDGSGLKPDELKINAKVNLKSIDFKGYIYNGISIDGYINNKLLKGNLSVEDKNIQLSLGGIIDLRNNTPQYKLNLVVDKANIGKTNIVRASKGANIKGRVEVTLAGEKLDDMVGAIVFSDIEYDNGRDIYQFNSLKLSSSIVENNKNIIIESKDVVSGRIYGYFTYGDLTHMFIKSLDPNSIVYNKKDIREAQDIKFNISIKDKILDAIAQNINLKSSISIDGSLNGNTNHLKLNLHSRGVEYNGTFIDSLSLWVDNKNPSYNAILSIGDISGGAYHIHDLNLAMRNRQDSMYIYTTFQGGDSIIEHYNINLYQTIDDKSNLTIGFLDSKMKIFDNEFKISQNKENKIIYNLKTHDFEIDTISIDGGAQKLLFAGESYNKNQKYKIVLEKIRLSKIGVKNIGLNTKGIVNASIFVEINKGNVKPIINLSIDSLEMEGNYMGDLVINMNSKENSEKYEASVVLNENGTKTIDAFGEVDLSIKKPTLSMHVLLDELKLNFINIFTEDLFSNIKGGVSGEVEVAGLLNNPKIDGFLDLKKAAIGIDYLNVIYNLGDERITVKDHEILIPKTAMTTTYGGKITRGNLYGSIKNHDNYKSWDLNLKVEANDMLTLNTTEDENPLFYGTVYTSGECTMIGPASSLKFNIVARTEKGTTFYIPLDKNSEVNENSIVFFTAPNNNDTGRSKSNNVKKEIESLDGLELFFNLDVTQDALVEIVLDKKVGDVMKSKGSGVINMDINSRGDLSINGTYTLDEGDYLFTMQNLINKKFKVKKGGTISWTGDPMDATINLEAVYKTKTQVASYLDYNTEENYNKLLVELILKLKGELMKPEISFDIKIPDAETNLQTQLEMKLRENESERSRQFITLITLNSFSSSNQDIALTGSVASSATELITNQIANLASGISDKVDVSVGYISRAENLNDINNNDELEVGLSSQLFNDMVTVNGNVGVPVGSSQSSIVGDLEVLVSLTKDRRLKLKIFNRQNVVTDLTDSDGYTQGVGLSYQTSFNTFSEFIMSLFKKKSVRPTIITPKSSVEEDNNSPIRFE